MHLCRAAWRKLVPLARASSTPLLRNAPLRSMSSSSVPGSSGDGLIYYLVVGVSVAGAGFYIYRTLHRDKARYADRASYIEGRQPEWKAKPWPPQSGNEGEETVSAEMSKDRP
ncbi:protein MGARP-like isoform X1 [Microcaecilia unicolor]|uniref:Protein MGARP-like isoform X1 n=1 Tax=Microcaecilia unicolor TaxID=1415580 RepID=A0A6P7X2V1_9AMPH|nr:protein MGARP-like isoform X1 [Microcaecilia unicolor]